MAPARVLLAKGGLDGHDRGIKLLATTLRNAGMEVIYLGTHQTTQRVVRAAVDEDVDIVGLSCHAGEHVFWTREVREQLDQFDAQDTRLVVGGVFPVHDLDAIQAAGADLVFRIGDSMTAIVAALQELVAPLPA
jgi:methylmalonyl-CoA mutase C-terminal domain/subunit